MCFLFGLNFRSAKMPKSKAMLSDSDSDEPTNKKSDVEKPKPTVTTSRKAKSNSKDEVRLSSVSSSAKNSFLRSF